MRWEGAGERRTWARGSKGSSKRGTRARIFGVGGSPSRGNGGGMAGLLAAMSSEGREGRVRRRRAAVLSGTHEALREFTPSAHIARVVQVSYGGCRAHRAAYSTCCPVSLVHLHADLPSPSFGNPSLIQFRPLTSQIQSLLTDRKRCVRSGVSEHHEKCGRI